MQQIKVQWPQRSYSEMFPSRRTRFHVPKQVVCLFDLIWRALSKAGIQRKKPSGRSRTDGKLPDGVTLIPCQRGKQLAWDVEVETRSA